MSLTIVIHNLSKAFEAIARAMETEMPDLWHRAADMIPDEKGRAEFFTRPAIGFDGKNLIEIAKQDKGIQAVLNYIGHVKCGGFA